MRSKRRIWRSRRRAQLRIAKGRAKGKAFIATAEAELGQARAELALAELELRRTNISFPYATRVAKADISVGELVGPADTVVGPASTLGVVCRPEALQVDAPVELKDLEYLDPAIGRAAQIRTWSETYEAKIVRVSSLVTPQTRMASLFFKFLEPLDSLPLPNTFVEVVITAPSYENVYLLPEAVLQERGSVWVVSGGVLKRGPSDARPPAWWSRHSTLVTALSSARCQEPGKAWPSW